MVLNLGCTLELPGDLLKILTPGPHPPEILVLVMEWGHSISNFLSILSS